MSRQLINVLGGPLQYIFRSWPSNTVLGTNVLAANGQTTIPLPAAGDSAVDLTVTDLTTLLTATYRDTDFGLPAASFWALTDGMVVVLVPSVVRINNSTSSAISVTLTQYSLGTYLGQTTTVLSSGANTVTPFAGASEVTISGSFGAVTLDLSVSGTAQLVAQDLNGSLVLGLQSRTGTPVQLAGPCPGPFTVVEDGTSTTVPAGGWYQPAVGATFTVDGAAWSESVTRLEVWPWGIGCVVTLPVEHHLQLVRSGCPTGATVEAVINGVPGAVPPVGPDQWPVYGSATELLVTVGAVTTSWPPSTTYLAVDSDCVVSEPSLTFFNQGTTTITVTVVLAPSGVTVVEPLAPGEEASFTPEAGTSSLTVNGFLVVPGVDNLVVWLADGQPYADPPFVAVRNGCTTSLTVTSSYGGRAVAAGQTAPLYVTPTATVVTVTSGTEGWVAAPGQTVAWGGPQCRPMVSSGHPTTLTNNCGLTQSFTIPQVDGTVLLGQLPPGAVGVYMLAHLFTLGTAGPFSGSVTWGPDCVPRASSWSLAVVNESSTPHRVQVGPTVVIVQPGGSATVISLTSVTTVRIDNEPAQIVNLEQVDQLTITDEDPEPAVPKEGDWPYSRPCSSAVVVLPALVWEL